MGGEGGAIYRMDTASVSASAALSNGEGAQGGNGLTNHKSSRLTEQSCAAIVGAAAMLT